MLACSGRRDSGPAAGEGRGLAVLALLVEDVGGLVVVVPVHVELRAAVRRGGRCGRHHRRAAPTMRSQPSAAGPGRVLGGGGAWLVTFCVVLGACDGELLIAAGMFDWLDACGDTCVTTFGSEPRPGGGGGFDGEAGGAFDRDATRIDPDCGGDDGSGGGAEMRPPEGGPAGGEEGAAGIPDADADGVVGGAGGIAGMAPWLGGWAGPGIPIRVLFMSMTGFAAARFGAEAGLRGRGRRGGRARRALLAEALEDIEVRTALVVV